MITRRELYKLGIALLGSSVLPIKTMAKPEPKFYPIMFGIGMDGPIVKDTAICPDFIVTRAGTIVAQDISPIARGGDGGLFIDHTLNGRKVILEGQRIQIGDKLNIDVSYVTGIWENIIIIFKVKEHDNVVRN